MQIPDDFPRELTISSLAGVQPKAAVRLDGSRGTYVSGMSEAEVQERYEVCADLVDQLVAKCQKNRATKYAALSEIQILERLLAQLLGTAWGSDAEMAWVIRRTASELDWAVPSDAGSLRAMLGFDV